MDLSRQRPSENIEDRRPYEVEAQTPYIGTTVRTYEGTSNKLLSVDPAALNEECAAEISERGRRADEAFLQGRQEEAYDIRYAQDLRPIDILKAPFGCDARIQAFGESLGKEDSRLVFEYRPDPGVDLKESFTKGALGIQNQAPAHAAAEQEARYKLMGHPIHKIHKTP